MFACVEACKPGNPATDTVRVGMRAQEVEETEPRRAGDLEAAELQAAELQEAERQETERKEEEAHQRALEAEEVTRCRRQEEVAAAERLAQEERDRREAERREAERAEAARRAEAVRAEKRKAVAATFLRDNGFKGVNAPKKTLMLTTYPLHCAAEKGNLQMVEVLLEQGADPARRNSRGKTYGELLHDKGARGSGFRRGVQRVLGGA